MKEKIFLSRFCRQKKSCYILSITTAIIILFLFIDYTLLSTQPTYAQSFGNLTNLSNNTGFSSNPQITTFGSNIYVVWRDNSSGNDDIYFSSSVDNGTTFSSPKNLSTNLDGPALFPQVEAIGN